MPERQCSGIDRCVLSVVAPSVGVGSSDPVPDSQLGGAGARRRKGKGSDVSARRCEPVDADLKNVKTPRAFPFDRDQTARRHFVQCRRAQIRAHREVQRAERDLGEACVGCAVNPKGVSSHVRNLVPDVHVSCSALGIGDRRDAREIDRSSACDRADRCDGKNCNQDPGGASLDGCAAASPPPIDHRLPLHVATRHTTLPPNPEGRLYLAG